MFQKILIANRGEIACRVIKTARKMGIKTVAVYSDADASAKHVTLADEAVHIGPSEVSKSYLQGETIIEAAQRTGAEAIHPGYGFLSENPGFVEAVNKAGITFIGPTASAIDAMGLKDKAKELMINAGVPVVPGYHGSNQDPTFLANQADEIGYPVLIKARAGGGGKGMRLVENAADFEAELGAAQREAQASFGDPSCLIEKYIQQPRHIEIQVFGDQAGNIIHLFERDCSLQRRHQKVIEEAPAPDIPESVRQAMCKAATDAAKAIGYQGAGTVEFIVDGSGPLREDGFWFMEMNTRLQVEHPVTEAITGLDLVELQLRVAAGEPLPVSQDDVQINGWAFEARIYAEDVQKGFLPAAGHLEHLSFPFNVEFEHGALRVDSGVRSGDTISTWYDPMIAKVIVHSNTRTSALSKLSSAIAQTQIIGTVTNVAFIGALSRHAGFRAGKVDTGLIERDIESLSVIKQPDSMDWALGAVAMMGLLPADNALPWDKLIGFRHWGVATQSIDLKCAEVCRTVAVTILDAGHFALDALEFKIEYTANGFCVSTANQKRQTSITVFDNKVSVTNHDAQHLFEHISVFGQQDSNAHAQDSLLAQMPGQVVQVFVSKGDEVKRDDPLIILEAMKMEHRFNAPRDGTVADILFSVGDQVADGALLISLEPESDGEFNV